MLLLLIFGIIDCGRMLNAQITLTEAAREAARAVALDLPAEPRVAAATTGLSPVPAIDSEACTGTDQTEDNATVDLSYAFQPITPIGTLMGVVGGGAGGSFTITARGVMPCVG